MEGHHGVELFILPVAFLASAVVLVPIFKRLGLGGVLGYLVAGMLLNAPGIRLVEDPEAIMQVAELGVVFLLFLIGLELNPSRLWAMRRDIFGLGAAQIIVCGGVLALYPLLIVGDDWRAAVIAGFGLALSSTALVMQIIEERNAMRQPYGQKTFAVLLMQDIAIVPLLLLVTLLSPGQSDVETDAVAGSVLIALVALGAVVLIGHYALSPIFRILARFGGREIMTAAALLVVLAAGTAMLAAGLSMAMGAFIAGVLLAESNYQRELEANIEPFRGLLLGLFFISVGMTIDVRVVFANIGMIAAGVGLLLVAKTLIVYALVRLFGGDHRTGVKSGLLLSQGGEFGFVLFTAAASAGILTAQDSTLFSTIVILSMISTPFLIRFVPLLLLKPQRTVEPDEDFEGAGGEVLIVGFGRFGQLVSQMLLAGGFEPTLLDSDPDRVQEARRFGTRVYYGDGTRLDVLRAAGAERCSLIAVCTNDPAATTEVVDIAKAHFPHAKTFARAFDRRHALTLFDHKVDYQRRETLDTALQFGRDALLALGLPADAAIDSEALVRKRDIERLEYQRIEGLVEGHRKWQEVTPEPFTREDDTDRDQTHARAAE